MKRVFSILTIALLGAACTSADRPKTEVTVLLNPLLKVAPPPAIVCGNQVTEGSEQCDDGNTTSDDGCSATCTFEVGPDVTAQNLPCSVDVGREPATVHPNPGLQGYVMGLNDQVRAITGLPIDLFIGEGGVPNFETGVESATTEIKKLGQIGVLRCLTPVTGKSAVIDASTGAAIARVLQLRGMPPKNHDPAVEPLRPGVDEVLKRPLQLLPPPADGLDPSISAAITALPPGGIVADPLLSIIPDATVNSAKDGTYQINNMLRIHLNETTLPAIGAGKAIANTGDRVLNIQAEWQAGPDACAWATDSCPPEKRVPNILDRHIDPSADVIEPLKILVAAKRAANEDITMAVFDELFSGNPALSHLRTKKQRFFAITEAYADDPARSGNATYDTSEYLHMQFLIADVSVQQLVTGGFVSAQGGCSCRLAGDGATDPRALASALLGFCLGSGVLFLQRRRVAVRANAGRRLSGSGTPQ